jgi:hypothetical protein
MVCKELKLRYYWVVHGKFWFNKAQPLILVSVLGLLLLAGCGEGSTNSTSSPSASAVPSGLDQNLVFTGEVNGTITHSDDGSAVCSILNGQNNVTQFALYIYPSPDNFAGKKGWRVDGTVANFNKLKLPSVTDLSIIHTDKTLEGQVTAGYTTGSNAVTYKTNGTKGTLIVNLDQNSGSIDADMVNNQGSGTVAEHVKGDWKCNNGDVPLAASPTPFRPSSSPVEGPIIGPIPQNSP